jgi:competence protein ComEC
VTSDGPPVPQFDIRLVPAALASWAVTAAGILWPVGQAVAVGCLLAAAGAAVVCRRLPREREVARAGTATLLAVLLVGAGFGLAISLRTNSIRDHPIAERYGSTAEVTVIATETPRSIGPGRTLFKADLKAVGPDEMAGRAVVFASGVGFGDVSAGLPVRFSARIGRPTRRDLSVAVLYASGAPAVGQASAVQSAAAATRERFSAQARTALPSAQAAMLPALVLGDTSAVTGATAAEFRAAGLTHLTAVSGANVTIVCGAVLLMGRLVGPRVAVGMAGTALIAFVIVVQPSASVLRAAVMGAIALAAIATSRRRQAIPALAATVIALLIVAPHLAVEVGFALSVSATAGLVVLAPLWSRRLLARGWPKPVADAVCVAVAAQLVTAPLVAGISGTLSVVAVGANLAVAVLIAPITVLGTAAAVLCPFWPAAGQLLIRFTGPELWWLLHVAQWAARVPNATVPVPSGVGGVVLLALATVAAVVLWRFRWFRVAAACAVACLIAWSVSGWAHGQSLVTPSSA